MVESEYYNKKIILYNRRLYNKRAILQHIATEIHKIAKYKRRISKQELRSKFKKHYNKLERKV